MLRLGGCADDGAADRATGGAYPDHCRVELGGIGTSPLAVEGSLDGSWPTS